MSLLARDECQRTKCNQNENPNADEKILSHRVTSLYPNYRHIITRVNNLLSHLL